MSSMRWVVVGAFLLGVAVGAGIVWVYAAQGGKWVHQYTCTCTQTQGGAVWNSYPEGGACPPAGRPASVCP